MVANYFHRLQIGAHGWNSGMTILALRGLARSIAPCSTMQSTLAIAIAHACLQSKITLKSNFLAL